VCGVPPEPATSYSEGLFLILKLVNIRERSVTFHGTSWIIADNKTSLNRYNVIKAKINIFVEQWFYSYFGLFEKMLNDAMFKMST